MTTLSRLIKLATTYESESAHVTMLISITEDTGFPYTQAGHRPSLDAAAQSVLEKTPNTKKTRLSVVVCYARMQHTDSMYVIGFPYTAKTVLRPGKRRQNVRHKCLMTAFSDGLASPLGGEAEHFYKPCVDWVVTLLRATI